MNAETILALITAILTNAPKLSADVTALIKALTTLIEGNPGATTAEIQAQIAASLSDAAATDAAVEAGV